MRLVIFGAQGTALGAYRSIRHLYPVREVECFPVTRRGINAEYLAGLPALS